MGKIKLSELNQALSADELAMIKNASDMPITYDEDSPVSTPEMLEQFRAVAKSRRQSRRKQVLSIRVSEDTMTKAKSLGDGYSGILSRMLEYCLNNPSIIKKCL